MTKSTYKVLQQEDGISGSKTEATIHATSGPAPKPWNTPPGLKFPCPLASHKHEVTTCAEFFSLSPLVLWIDGKRLKRAGCVFLV